MAKAAAPVIADPQETVAFSSLLAELEAGDFDRDLSNAFRTLIQGMTRRYQTGGGKPSGRVSLTIDLALIDGLIQTRQTFKVDPPEARPAQQFYPTADGGLRQHRRAEQIDLLPAINKTKRGGSHG